MKTQKSVGTKGTGEVAAGVVRVQLLIPEGVRDLGNAPARVANERQAVLGKNSIWTEVRQRAAPLSSVAPLQ